MLVTPLKIRLLVMGRIEIAKWIITNVLLLSVFPLAFASPSSANPVPANDGVGTIVTIDGRQFDISGGQLSGDQGNLFHSFQEFGLTQAQIANFLSNPQIHNILVRVGGGEASFIDGVLQVSGGSSNLFFMNPSGITFGPHATLNLPADFVATTADGIRFGDKWFGAMGSYDYSALMGAPDGFIFTADQPGAILNLADLSTQVGHNLALLGGTVASPGNLSAPAGELTITSVPGNRAIRIGQPGSMLQLEVELPEQLDSLPQDWVLPVLSLPQLLTSAPTQASAPLAVSNNQTVQIRGSGFQILPGDIYAQQVEGGTVSLTAANNLTAVGGNFQSAQALQLSANANLQLRDTTTQPLILLSGEELHLQGNQLVDILALTHPETSLGSGGNLRLVSGQPVSADTHFTSGGTFSILNLEDAPGDFSSLYDPIISANSDVVFGNYTGASLKIESLGSIQGGNITITSPDIGLTGTDPDIGILTSSHAVILRAGLDSLENAGNVPTTVGSQFFPTIFSPVPDTTDPGNISVGNINTGFNGADGNVILSADGDISTGNLDTSPFSEGVTGGAMQIEATGDISTGNISATAIRARGGTIFIESDEGNVSTGNIDISSLSGPGGILDVAAPIGATVSLGNIRTEGFGNDTIEGVINLPAGTNTSTGAIDSNVLPTTSPTLIEPPPSSTFSTPPAIESELSTEDLESQIDREFEQYFGRDFTREIVDSKNLRYALHEMEKQEDSIKAAVVYVSSRRDRVFIRVETSQALPIEIRSIAEFELEEPEQERLFQPEPKGKTPFRTDRAKQAQPGQSNDQPDSQPGSGSGDDDDDSTGDGLSLERGESVSRDALVLGVENLWRDIQQPGTDDYLQHAEQLYDLLIRPIERKLDEEGIKVDTLLFSMESGLRLIPLAALYDSETDEFLAEKYKISIIPNFSSLDFRRNNLQQADVLAMGISEFADSDTYPPLSAVPLELQLINNIWVGDENQLNGTSASNERSQTRVISNEQVTIETLRNARREHPFQIVHLATHANFNPGDASDSEIQLWDSTLPLNPLQVDTLSWNNPPIDLLILSACQTALGDESAELGFAGLSLQAEVKSTLASLWYVSDLGTLIYMMEFYRNLGTSATKAEAVRKTQLAMLDEQRLQQNLNELEVIIQSLLRNNDVRWASEDSSRSLTETEIQGIETILRRLRRERGEVISQLTHPFYWSAFTLVGSPW